MVRITGLTIDKLKKHAFFYCVEMEKQHGFSMWRMFHNHQYAECIAAGIRIESALEFFKLKKSPLIMCAIQKTEFNNFTSSEFFTTTIPFKVEVDCNYLLTIDKGIVSFEACN